MPNRQHAAQLVRVGKEASTSPKVELQSWVPTFFGELQGHAQDTPIPRP